MDRVVIQRQCHHQDGAVIVTVSLVLLFLMGFMAIALDLGHLFVVKTELQTAMDSCALAAAQELDGESSALTRATSAGITAGNLNNVNFQSATWSGKGMVTATDISFKDAAYGATTVAANARYAQCQHTQPGVNMWLLQSMAAFSGNTAAYTNTQNVLALAVATRASAQTTCPVPVGLKPKTGGTAPNYGFQIGEWVTMIGNGTAVNGEMGWYNLNGSTNASETKTELGEPGYCGTKLGDTLGTPGIQSSVDTVWNYRFGIYKNNDPGPSVDHPDFSGYAYTSANWKNASPQNAWSGTPAAGSDSTAANFTTKRAAFASYDDTGTSVSKGDTITSLSMKGGFKTLATPGAGGEHNLYGFSRRLVTSPVVDASNKVIDYACMFMLQPLSGPTVSVQLEFRGNAGSTSSPCTTNGLAGGTAGPLVPTLVR
ncbi:pilus assembly protein TadG-related protein [Collimonas sp.]|uniref:pilus assembly protein TadG-related protein n=1 Tax=Collimonas sp. TaxID=1963772 RepID=UPI002B634E24|nr:pilus assembly protein TadG-related protein [Collimonas sp.]HWW07250.1 pilus assembly protein TadG-related protein [Collimonas sp.]